MVMMMMVMVIL